MTRGGKRKGAGRRSELDGGHTVSVNLDCESEVRLEIIRVALSDLTGVLITRSGAARWAFKNCKDPK